MKSLQTTLLAGFFVFFAAAPVLSAATPLVSSVGAAAADCEGRFLGIPPWYRGLTNGVAGDCAINPPATGGDGLSSFIWKIVLNVIEMVLVITAYIAGFFVMYGGFLWLTAGARPDLVTKGRKAIMNALIGLIISMSAIAFTNLIFGIIK